MSPLLTLAAACAALFLGATVQRITGIGITLISAPVLAVAFGPLTAVPLCNTLALALNLAIVATALHHVEWRRAGMIALGAGLAIVPLAPLLRQANAKVLQAVIGAAVLVAIAVTLRLRHRAHRMDDNVLARISAGATAGAFGSAAGLSGPPLAIYAVRTGWQGPTFVPTIQGASAAINVLAVAAAPRIAIPPLWWVVLIAAVGAGMLAGTIVAPRVNTRGVESIALGLAALGAGTTLALAAI